MHSHPEPEHILMLIRSFMRRTEKTVPKLRYNFYLSFDVYINSNWMLDAGADALSIVSNTNYKLNNEYNYFKL